MKQEQLNAIKDRAERASLGPWMFDKGSTERGNVRPAVITHFGNDGDEYIHGDIAEMVDAEFIAHAREDVPALVTEVEYLREMLRDTRKIVRNKVSEVKTLQNACKKHKEKQKALEFQLKVSIQHAEELDAELEAEVAENEQLREALKFYANNSNYLIEWSDKCDEYMPSVADNDGGEIARQALGVN